MKRKLALVLALLMLMACCTEALAAMKCVWCNGKGEVKCTNCGGSGSAPGSVRGSCFKCLGSGYESCRFCGGSGTQGSTPGGGSGSGGAGGGAAGMFINNHKLTLVAGRTATLKVNGTSKTVKWSSSNKAVATVSSKGKVKAKKAGKATITGKVGKNSFTCKLTVKKKVYASSIKLNKPSGTYLIGEGEKLGYTISPKESKITEKYSVSWSSSNTGVAVVDKDGNVTAVGPGSATITAKLKIKKGKTKKASRTVNVETGLNRFTNWFMANSAEANGLRIYYRGADSQIIYDPGANTWTFTQAESDSQERLTFDGSFTGTAYAEYHFKGRFTSLEVTATGTAPVENLSTNCGYDWTFTQGSAVSHSRLANASMATVLSGFQVLLKEQAHVSWKDIGLTGY